MEVVKATGNTFISSTTRYSFNFFLSDIIIFIRIFEIIVIQHKMLYKFLRYDPRICIPS